MIWITLIKCINLSRFVLLLGNLLLPPFGYCEVFESAKDIKLKVGNQHKFICEISQHVLYQYCLIVLWFALIVGVLISVIGILVLLVRYILGVCRIRYVREISILFIPSVIIPFNKNMISLPHVHLMWSYD